MPATRDAKAPTSRRPRVLLLALGIGLVLTMLGTMRPACANMRQCASHSLSVKDLVAVRTAAMRALRGLAPLDPTVGGACRNPTSADAWLESTRHQRPDGIREWWALRCNREADLWSCEATHEREFDLEVTTVAGEKRAVVRLDPQTDVELARTNVEQVVRALTVQSPKALAEGCVAAMTGPVTPDPSRIPAGTVPVPQPLGASVAADGAVEVYLGAGDLFQYRVQPDVARTGVSEVCWHGMIVVT